MALSALDDLERNALAALVRKHKVAFQIYPAMNFITGERMDVGYDLELLGTHETGTTDVMPGCDRCRLVWDDLRRVAEAVLPADLTRASAYEIRRFDRALHTASGDAGRDDVLLAISIRHKRDYASPVDECEERCLREMVADLRALGAQKGRWSEGAKPTRRPWGRAIQR